MHIFRHLFRHYVIYRAMHGLTHRRKPHRTPVRPAPAARRPEVTVVPGVFCPSCTRIGWCGCLPPE